MKLKRNFVKKSFLLSIYYITYQFIILRLSYFVMSSCVPFLRQKIILSQLLIIFIRLNLIIYV